ncbi:AMP-binding protein [Roseomonas sp. E05]|uniref:AMP-binding protein n=1 Tax=Roseomonas sp. E05 TaxID=3046310 RepID=UPI0024B95071|nr:AMP-binding protein [Roseomonas sp. E05]MDJ0389060.1 AMP-binding protein [Roseomonas sp. E05]
MARLPADRTRHGSSDGRQDLFSRIEAFGTALAVVDESGRSWSHAEFAAHADAGCAPLPPKRCFVAVEAANALHSLAAYVGALRAGHAVLLLKEGEGEGCPLLERFRPDFVYRADRQAWQEGSAGPAEADLHPDLAVLLATSGSTGEPKLVRLSNTNLLSNALAIAEYLGFRPGERAITTLPFHYSYGMSVINSHLATGGALILNQDSVAEPAFWRRFEAFEATSLAGVPHSFALLERSGFLSRPLPASLRYITQAGGKLPEDKVRRFADHAEAQGRRFYVMYGQTEAAPRIAYVPPALLKRHPAAIGVPVPGGKIALLDERGVPIDAANAEGELVYSGPNVMMGYALRREDLGRGAELSELRTGDLAVRNAEGLFTITGRKSRFIKPFGLRIGLDDIEARLREAGFEGAATGTDDGLQIAVVAPASTEAVVELVLRQHALPATSVQVAHVAEVPRLPSGKVDYAGIRRVFDASAAPAGQAGRNLSLHAAFADLLGRPDLGRDESFASAGGDSLNFINALLLVEERLGFAPEGWERMTICELEAAKARKPDAAEVSASQTKLFFLDQVRASLMLLGIPFHTALAYTAFPWIAKGGEPSSLLMNFSEFLNTFRMPAFFLLAGFFAMMFVDEKSPAKWWRSRAVQLGLPLFATILLINPLLMLARALNTAQDADVMATWLALLTTPGQHWIEHAWFLVFLLAYTLVLALLCGLWRGRPIRRDTAALAERVLASRTSLALTAIAAGLASTLGVGVLKVLGITFAYRHMLYLSEMAALLPVFAMGCLVASRRDFIGRFASVDWSAIALALGGAVILTNIQLREETLYRVVTFFLVPIMGIYWSKLLCFVALRWFDAPNRWTRLLVNASMTVYLIHILFIVFLANAFAYVQLPSLVEFLIITGLAGALSLGFHQIVARHWLLMLLFTGTARGRRGTAAPGRQPAGRIVRSA